MRFEKGKVNSFRDLIVWQRSIQMCVEVYEFTRGFPGDELYGLRSQLRRASVSVSSNIAEGYGRRSRGEYLQFLGMARGSNHEVQTQLVIASRLGFGDADGRLLCESLGLEVERMLNSYMASLEAAKPASISV